MIVNCDLRQLHWTPTGLASGNKTNNMGLLTGICVSRRSGARLAIRQLAHALANSVISRDEFLDQVNPIFQYRLSIRKVFLKL